MKLETLYDVGDKVVIDGDRHIVGLVLAMSVRGTGKNITYDVAWFHCGNQQSAWIEGWRLEPWDG